MCFRGSGRGILSTGLIALLDDVAAIAKAAAASIDDVATQAAQAGVKSAGVLIDDAAVTPRYVVGLAAERELPIIAKITRGSLRNKLLFLLPGALALSLFAPWLITPILMLGGLYLSYEGAEKIYEKLFPHKAHLHEAAVGLSAGDPQKLEDQRVQSAIKTDFILSAEIMAITLSAIPPQGFWAQAAILALVGIGITFVVYGSVAIIVKADDVGLALANRTVTTGLGRLSQAFGRGLVRGMPVFLSLLAAIGTAAMVWVGGGILIHGLETLGVPGPAHLLHAAEAAAGQALPALGGFAAWLASALAAFLAGLLVGFALIPCVSLAVVPLWRRLRALSAGLRVG